MRPETPQNRPQYHRLRRFSFSLARKMLHAFEGTPLDMRSTLDSRP